MRFVIIGLLLDGPLSGYAVQQRFAQVVSLFYSASLGSIQRALQGLVDDGLATVEADPRSARGGRLHRLTASARPLWEQWMLAPVDGGQLEREMLARVFFLDRLDEADARLTVLRGLRQRAEQELAALRALEQRIGRPDGFAAQLATLGYGLRSTALAIEWLGELEDAERGGEDAGPGGSAQSRAAGGEVEAGRNRRSSAAHPSTAGDAADGGRSPAHRPSAAQTNGGER